MTGYEIFLVTAALVLFGLACLAIWVDSKAKQRMAELDRDIERNK